MSARGRGAQVPSLTKMNMAYHIKSDVHMANELLDLSKECGAAAAAGGDGGPSHEGPSGTPAPDGALHELGTEDADEDMSGSAAVAAQRDVAVGGRDGDNSGLGGAAGDVDIDMSAGSGPTAAPVVAGANGVGGVAIAAEPGETAAALIAVSVSAPSVVVRPKAGEYGRIPVPAAPAREPKRAMRARLTKDGLPREAAALGLVPDVPNVRERKSAGAALAPSAAHPAAALAAAAPPAAAVAPESEPAGAAGRGVSKEEAVAIAVPRASKPAAPGKPLTSSRTKGARAGEKAAGSANAAAGGVELSAAQQADHEQQARAASVSAGALICDLCDAPCGGADERARALALLNHSVVWHAGRGANAAAVARKDGDADRAWTSAEAYGAPLQGCACVRAYKRQVWSFGWLFALQSVRVTSAMRWRWRWRTNWRSCAHSRTACASARSLGARFGAMAGRR